MALSKAKEIEQPILLTTLVQNIPVDLSEEMVQRVIYGPKFPQAAPKAEFDHKMKVVRDKNAMRDPARRGERMR